MSEVLNYEVLAQQLNTKFAVLDMPAPFELELIEVTEPTATKSQTYFSLYFRGGKDLSLPQGTYQMKHERLGTLALFIVPVERNNEGFKYEAVFNLLNESS